MNIINFIDVKNILLKNQKIKNNKILQNKIKKGIFTRNYIFNNQDKIFSDFLKSKKKYPNYYDINSKDNNIIDIHDKLQELSYPRVLDNFLINMKLPFEEERYLFFKRKNKINERCPVITDIMMLMI